MITRRAILCRCGLPARPGQANCNLCHAEYMRSWRPAHPPSPAARARSNARAYLHVYIRREKIIPQPCEVCGATPAQAHHDDYSKPLAVLWLCKDHHDAITHAGLK